MCGRQCRCRRLSFGDGDSFSAYDDLVKAAMILYELVKPGSHWLHLPNLNKLSSDLILHLQDKRRQTLSTAIRCLESVASIQRRLRASGAFGPCHPRFETSNRLKADAINEEDIVVIQPDTISRLSSSNSSILPGEGARFSVDPQQLLVTKNLIT